MGIKKEIGDEKSVAKAEDEDGENDEEKNKKQKNTPMIIRKQNGTGEK